MAFVMLHLRGVIVKLGRGTHARYYIFFIICFGLHVALDIIQTIYLDDHYYTIQFFIVNAMYMHF